MAFDEGHYLRRRHHHDEEVIIIQIRLSMTQAHLLFHLIQLTHNKLRVQLQGGRANEGV